MLLPLALREAFNPVLRMMLELKSDTDLYLSDSNWFLVCLSININGVSFKWSFALITEPGVGFGPPNLVPNVQNVS